MCMDMAEICNPQCEMSIVLLFTGSFNPIHLIHIELLCTIKKELEKCHTHISTAFIAPCSDDDLRKMGHSVIPFKHRCHMCRIAIREHPWIRLCRYGLSVHDTCEQLIYDGLISKRTIVYEVGGSDYALKYNLHQSNQPFICIERESKPLEPVRITNPDFIILGKKLFPNVNSSEIRHSLRHRDFETHVKRGWIDPLVMEHLRTLYV